MGVDADVRFVKLKSIQDLVHKEAGCSCLQCKVDLLSTLLGLPPSAV